MATLREELFHWNNDYTDLEREYYRATGSELIADPYSLVDKGSPVITKSASVLIGTYNSGESLEKCLISIEQSSLNKKYPHLLEVIVVDDGSTDGTMEMLQNLEVNVPLKYILQDRGGLTKAHNMGLAFVENDIIIFSDSDMVHTQYALEELMKRHEVLSNVTLAGFRFEIDPADPRISSAYIREKHYELLPEFYQDFRLNFPGCPANICRETRHWKDYGFYRKIMMANGAGYDLPAMVVGAFFSIRREDYIKMGGSENRLRGWGCEDSLIGARSIALGNYIIPVYGAASAHISHPRRGPNEGHEFMANIRTVSAILDEEFVPFTEDKIPNYQSRIKEYFVKAPSESTPDRQNRLQPYPLSMRTANDHVRCGKASAALGFFESALEHFEEAITLSPDSSWLHLEKGKALRDWRQYEAAITVFSHCLEQNPEDAWASYESGLTYAAMADYMKARQACECAKHLAPDIFNFKWALETSSEQHKRRGNFHAGQGSHELAIRDFELALIVDPHNCWAHFDRGLSLRSLHRLDEGLQAFRRTDELLHKEDCNRTWVHTELGKIYFDLGDDNSAKLQLQTAYRLFPGNPQANYYLNRLNEKLEQENGIICHLPIIDSMKSIDGWFSDEEADLLIAAIVKAASLEFSNSEFTSMVEIGSFCGKSTIIFGSTIKSANKQGLKLYAIDPHEGYQFGGNLKTYPILTENLARHNLQGHVEVIKDRSTQVKWNSPISLLFIDGLHDYVSVKNDFMHFRDFIIPCGLIAFHDYFPLCPGVEMFVDEILLAHEFQLIAQRGQLIVIRKGS